MFIDHLGMIFFPGYILFRIIGRLAMPIFAFFIAEGAYYTKNRTVYVSTMLLLGLITSLVAQLYTGSFELNILGSFSLSLIMIFLFDNIRKYRFYKNYKMLALSILIFVIYTASLLAYMYKYYIEYQLFALLIPFALSLTQSHYIRHGLPANNYIKAIVFVIVYILLLIISNVAFKINTNLLIQAYGIASVFFILAYNNKRGKYNLKYLFYIFYPTHLGIMWLIYFSI